MSNTGFTFKKFHVEHNNCAHKVGTDGVLIGAWASFNNPVSILDVGTGSGLLTLMLAQRFPKAQVTGIEKDGLAYTQALENVRQSPFYRQIQLIHSDVTLYNVSHGFDAIISNPPFFVGSSPSGNTLRDEARATIGLTHKTLIKKVATLLSFNGTLALILPKVEADNFIHLAKAEGLFLIKRCKVFGSVKSDDKRWMLQFSNHASKTDTPVEEELVLRDSTGGRSDAYQELCKDFYL